MNSSILKSLILILFSCNSHEETTHNINPIDTSIVASQHKQEKSTANTPSTRLDTTINGSIILWNSESTFNVFGDLSGKLKDYPNEGSFIVFKNKQGDKYLKMVHLPGSDPNTFRFFEVGYVKDFGRKIILLSSSVENFETESGVKLGVSIDFLKGKGRNYSETTEGNDVILKISETVDGLEYNATYHFKSGQLIKFGFGYNNP